MGRTARGRKFDGLTDSLTSFLNTAVLEPHLKNKSRESTLAFIDDLLEDYSEAEVQQSFDAATDVMVGEERAAATDRLQQTRLKTEESLSQVNEINQGINATANMKKAEVKNEKVRQALLDIEKSTGEKISDQAELDRLGIFPEDLEAAAAESVPVQQPSAGLLSSDPLMSLITSQILGDTEGRQTRGRRFLEQQRSLFSREDFNPQMIQVLQGLNKALGTETSGGAGTDIAQDILKQRLSEQIKFGAGGERDLFEARKAERRVGEFKDKEEERRKSQALKNQQILQRMKVSKQNRDRFKGIRSDVRLAVDGFNDGSMTKADALGSLDAREQSLQARRAEIGRISKEELPDDVEVNILNEEVDDIQETLNEIQKARSSIELLGKQKKPKDSQQVRSAKQALSAINNELKDSRMKGAARSERLKAKREIEAFLKAKGAL